MCKYKRAIACLDAGDAASEPSDAERNKQRALESACYLNLAGACLLSRESTRVCCAASCAHMCACWLTAACQLKQSQYKEAAESCRRVLANEPDSAKAHFRLGKALAGTDDLDEAKKELEQVTCDTRHGTHTTRHAKAHDARHALNSVVGVQALALEDLGEIRRELKLVEQRLRAHEKKQQQFYGKLFAKLGEDKSGAGGLYTSEEIAAANKPVFKKCNLWYAPSLNLSLRHSTTAGRLNFLGGGQRRASGGGPDGAARHQEAQQGVTRLLEPSYEESTSQSLPRKPTQTTINALNSSPSPTADIVPPLARLGLGKRHRSSRHRNQPIVWFG